MNGPELIIFDRAGKGGVLLAVQPAGDGDWIARCSDEVYGVLVRSTTSEQDAVHGALDAYLDLINRRK